MSDQALMQQALEALDQISKVGCDHTKKRCVCEYRSAADALRARLAEPEPEPVAWMVMAERQDGSRDTFAMTGRFKDVQDVCDFGDPIPLYTAPPARRPLTDEAIDALWRVACEKHSLCTTGELVRAFARTIERAHWIAEGKDE